ncbi:integral membrane protein S linking to the trans Golgi network-domain-containing protein [Umbelopsis sp. PMI_123]|nr:integral membrane protein S linking to the trans Golgi network-domain-containing protein [Umbelopsis sp. PMI_123]
MPASFRITTWDPILIVAQIISLQALYYVSISVVILLALAITGTELSLDYILSYTEIRADTVMGWTITMCWVINTIVGVGLMVLIVQRAKLILDFAVTLHAFHLIITSYYSRSIPSTFLWWLLNIFSCAVMTLMAEWTCMQREMEPIMVNARNEGDDSNSSEPSRKRKTSDHGIASSVVDKGKQILGTSSSKGKGKYETIPMNDIADSSHS